MTKCIICKGDVDWDSVKEEFEDTLSRVDMYGVESLTEHEQTVYEGKVCSTECFVDLP